MNFESLQTPRLFLRKTTPEAYHHVFTSFTDEELKSYFGITTDEELKKEKEQFQQGISTFNKSFLYFHLIHKTTNNVIGWCGFHTWYLKHDRAELGYVMNSEAHRGQGLMKEALTTVLQYGFNTMKLHRVEAFVGSDNMPSLRLLQQNRFVQEGVLREHYLVNSVYEDSLLYALLNRE